MNSSLQEAAATVFPPWMQVVVIIGSILVGAILAIIARQNPITEWIEKHIKKWRD